MFERKPRLSSEARHRVFVADIDFQALADTR